MYKGMTVKPPFFEVGPKAYMYGERILKLAKAADEASEKYDVRVILTVQPSDIYRLAKETKRVLFCQHMDPIPVGRETAPSCPRR